MDGLVTAAVVTSLGTLAATIVSGVMSHGARRSARAAHEEVKGNGTGVPVSQSQQEQIAMLREILDTLASDRTDIAAMAEHIRDADIHRRN